MSTWQSCLNLLQNDLPATEFETWLLPLHASEKDQEFILYAPNRFVLDWVRDHYFQKITDTLQLISDYQSIQLKIGHHAPAVTAPVATTAPHAAKSKVVQNSALNPRFTFDNFVEGKSNQLAKAAALQVAENPGKAYNPLFLYGGVGLGKTHLMHAIGNLICQNKKDAKILYLHSERFVADMVKATLNDIKLHKF